MSALPALSVVIPAYNEEQNLRPLYDRLCQVLAPYEEGGIEVVLVNDGSRDSSWQVITSLCEKDVPGGMTSAGIGACAIGKSGSSLRAGRV